MLKLQGFDTVEVTKKIDMPDIGELITLPFCANVDIEELYKYGGDTIRHIIDHAPIKNDRKYVTVNTKTQILSKNVTSAPRANWHFDTSSFKEDEYTRVHLLLSNTNAPTEFTENEIILEQFDENSSVLDVEVYCNHNIDSLVTGIKTVESNVFSTFNGGSHLHRAVRPTRTEFRFMFRILEGDVPGQKFHDSLTNMSEVYDDGITDPSNVTPEYIANNLTKSYKSIVKHDDKIEFYYI